MYHNATKGRIVGKKVQILKKGFRMPAKKVENTQQKMAKPIG